MPVVRLGFNHPLGILWPKQVASIVAFQRKLGNVIYSICWHGIQHFICLELLVQYFTILQIVFKFTFYDVHRFEIDPVVICHIWALII